LRVQCLHPGEGAPQRHPGADEALAQTVEQLGSVGAAEPFADRPDMQFNSTISFPEQAVEALREGRHPGRTHGIEHEFRFSSIAPALS
jgi:hypothetical protein